jgi:hypothetical protein
LVAGLVAGGVPAAAVQLMPTQDRAAVGAMLAAAGLIDMIVPRGGKSLVARVQADARVPVLAHLDGITPVEATYLQKCYRDAEAATTFTGEMTAQRALTAAVTRSLFPGATSFTFHYIHEDHPVLGTVTDATGNTLYTHSTGTPQDTKRATAIEAFLGGFPKDVLLDYFNDTATGYTHNF